MRTFNFALCMIALVAMALPTAASGAQPSDQPPGEADIIVHVSFVNGERVEYLGGVMDVTYVSERWDIVAGKAPVHLVGAISAFPFVTSVERSMTYHILLDVSARAVRARNDTLSGHTAYSPFTAWDLGYRGEGRIVAVLDSGVDDEYQGRLDDLDDDEGTEDPKFIGGYNAQTETEENPDDENGHGTLVAGVVMGTAADDDTWLGIAPQARLVDVRVAGSNGQTNSVQLLRGIEWCIQRADHDWDNDGPANDGIDVMLMSVGTEDTSDGSDAVSQAVNDAVASGIVVVAAMGNGNASVVPSPAAADLAIAVGGTTDRGTVDREHDAPWQQDATTGTNSGPRLDDGDDDPYDELKPDVAAPAWSISSADGGADIGDFGLFEVRTNGTEWGNGTSLAAAHVAGIAALMLEANPALRPDADRHPLRDILRTTAEQRGNPLNATLSPRYNVTWGFGLVDAYGAVVRAQDVSHAIMSIPGTVASEYKTTVSGKARLTSTEYTGPESVSFEFVMHRGWRDVRTESNVSLSIDGVKVLAELGSDDTAGMNITERPSTDGRWVVAGWANLSGDPGVHWVNVTLKMAAPSVGSVEAERTFTARFDLAYSGGGSASMDENITVETRWGSVSGTVTDETTGDPVEDVRVRLTIEDTSTMVNETFTGQDGTYILVNATEDYYDMEFFRTGYLKDSSSISRVKVEAGVENDGNDLELVRESDEGIVEGYVRNSTGPLNGASVSVLDGTSEVNDTESAADGFYRMRVAAGTYDIRISLEGYSTETVGSVVVNVGQATMKNVTLEEAKEPGTIKGTVRDDLGDAVEDAEIRVYAGSTLAGTTTTAQNGAYAIDVEPDTYRVRCVHPDYANKEVSGVAVAEGEEKIVDFDLEPASENGWLYGTVTEFGSGTPMSGATVQATAGKEEGSDVTDAAGGYRIILKPDYYNVLVQLSGYMDGSSANVRVLAGEGRLLDIELVRENEAPVVVSVDLSPPKVPADGITLFLLTVEVDDPDGPEDVEDVAADLSPLGGPSGQRLYDTGTHGDAVADDGTFSYEATVAKGTPGGSYTITVTVTDRFGESGTGTGSISVGKKDDDDNSPGFEVPILLASMGVAVALLARKRFK